MQKIDYSTVPVSYMAGAMQRYVEQGIEPGGFMSAMLCNDLEATVMRADGMNVVHIPHWVAWMSEHLPPACWGPYQRYEDWMAQVRPDKTETT